MLYTERNSKVVIGDIFGKMVFWVILFSLVFLFTPSKVFAADVWDGIGSNTGWVGQGTSDDPYIISTAAQLRGLADNVNDGTSYSGFCFKLGNDIDLAGHVWLPIGGHCSIENGVPVGPYFSGTFDGDNHTISGINISNPSVGTGAYGLFGYVRDGTIANLNVSGVLDMEGKDVDIVGAVVGYTSGSLYNLHSSVVVSGLDPVGSASHAGGIAGVVENNDSESVLCVRYCSNTGDVAARGRVGGIVGAVYCSKSGGVVIDQCFNLGNIESVSQIARKVYTGGVVGFCEGYITNCYNQGKIIRDTGNYVAGIAGMLNGQGSVASMSNCYSNAVFEGYAPTHDRWLWGSADHNPEVCITNCFYIETNDDMIQPNEDDSWGTQTYVSSITESQLRGDEEITGCNRSGIFSGYVLDYLGNLFDYELSGSYPVLRWQLTRDFIVDMDNLLPPETYYIVSTSVSEGQGTVTADPVNVCRGESCIITISPDSGYYLDSITDNGIDVFDSVSNNTYTINNVNINHTVVVCFLSDTYTLAYTAGEHGSVSGDLLQTVVPGDSGTEITAVPENGYYFAGWSDGSTDNPRTDTNVVANISVKAIFIKDSTGPRPRDYFTIAVLPDTQIYSEGYPEIFSRQTQWIADNAQSENIVFVAHLGDIVNDHKNNTQWQNALDSMAIIRAAGIPYSVVPGNCDMHFMTGDLTNYDTYFPYTDFTDYVWYGGHYPENSNASSYQLFSAMGQDFIVLNLVCEPSLLAETTDWANSILAEHNTRKAIVVTHGYIDTEGNYLGGSSVAGIDVWNNIVKHHDNVIMVLCGHHSGQYYGTDVGENGNTIYNFLTDYTYLENGGNGWLRLYKFYPYENVLKAVTYSPYLDQYDISTEGQFELPLKLTYKPKYIITPFENEVYEIGETDDGFNFMIVNPEFSGMKYFNAGITPIISHAGSETVVFVHSKGGVGGVQYSINAIEADFDLVSLAKAGFNVGPGDVVRVFIVDKLTNAKDCNPVILQ
ncbi:MAG: InlB B-repeat-containing protein [Candidatus Alkaliphilus sp. MAG34]